MIYSYYGYWDYWELRHKVTSDGITKRIYVNEGVNSINVKQDMYSDWKEWVMHDNNSKYPLAFRNIGGDPIDTVNGLYAGDIYFLMNGWQIVVDHNVSFNGVIYHDDVGVEPFIIQAGGGVRSVVSNLTQTVQTGESQNAPSVIQIRQEIDTNSTKLTNILSNISSVPDNVRTNLTSELSHLMTLSNAPTADNVASQVRVELEPELAIINSQVNGLTSEQLAMLTAMYRLMGLDPTRPLIVTPTTVDAGTIHQDITGNDTSTTVTRTT